jgi:asparagine synthase (glutamine-hydrolysing)
MAGIAGIARIDQVELVSRMLDKLAHRGAAGREVIQGAHATLGLVYPPIQAAALAALGQVRMVLDEAGHGHLVAAQATPQGVGLKRDELGIAPLYYGRTADGALCFASEVKALLAAATDVNELLPGYQYDGQQRLQYYELEKQPPLSDPPEQIAQELRRRLAASVQKRIGNGEVGAWLSGGLDSSTLFWRQDLSWMGRTKGAPMQQVDIAERSKDEDGCGWCAG